jgi:hypothetical protein
MISSNPHIRFVASLSLAATLLIGTSAHVSAAQPVVVELFTSQGCSSCPPANAVLARLADRNDILALSFGVTYWDELGWKDTFASPQFTKRQWDYAHALHHASVFTPQMVVQGRMDAVGQSESEVAPLIHAAEAREGGGPTIALFPDHVDLSSSAFAGTADVWLIRYDPRLISVPVHRGENGSRSLPHRNVVRQLIRLGPWTGRAARFDLAMSPDPSLRTAILVQAGPGGAILSAARG